MAQEMSEDEETKTRGGDLRYFTRPNERGPEDPQVAAEIVDAVFPLKNIGDVVPRLVKTAKGFHVTHAAIEKVEEKDHAAPVGAVSGGLATLALLMRQVPAEAAEYEMSTWSGEARAVQARTLSVKGVGRMKGEGLGIDREALWAVAAGGHAAIEIFVDPKDRTFLGMRPVGQPVWVVKKGILKAK